MLDITRVNTTSHPSLPDTVTNSCYPSVGCVKLDSAWCFNMQLLLSCLIHSPSAAFAIKLTHVEDLMLSNCYYNTESKTTLNKVVIWEDAQLWQYNGFSRYTRRGQ